MAARTNKVTKSAADEGEWSERLQAVREGVDDIDEEIRSTMREHPVACLCGALAAGYLVGRLVARS